MEGCIFCDLYDTLLDRNGCERLWPEAFGQLAAERWGGEPARWAAAHRIAQPEAAAELAAGIVAREGRGIRQLWHRYFRELLARQFTLVGAAVPPGLALAAVSRRLQAEAAARFGAALPGVEAALGSLQAAGFRLAIAADLPAPLAQGLLRGSRLERYFQGIFGPDVIGIAKISPEYYRRAFMAASTAADRCIVIAGRPVAQRWALTAGAAAALAPGGAPGAWATLPGRIAALAAGWW